MKVCTEGREESCRGLSGWGFGPVGDGGGGDQDDVQGSGGA